MDIGDINCTGVFGGLEDMHRLVTTASGEPCAASVLEGLRPSFAFPPLPSQPQHPAPPSLFPCPKNPDLLRLIHHRTSWSRRNPDALPQLLFPRTLRALSKLLHNLEDSGGIHSSSAV